MLEFALQLYAINCGPTIEIDNWSVAIELPSVFCDLPDDRNFPNRVPFSTIRNDLVVNGRVLTLPRRSRTEMALLGSALDFEGKMRLFKTVTVLVVGYDTLGDKHPSQLVVPVFVAKPRPALPSGTREGLFERVHDVGMQRLPNSRSFSEAPEIFRACDEPSQQRGE
jgi:hypothetical protein